MASQTESTRIRANISFDRIRATVLREIVDWRDGPLVQAAGLPKGLTLHGLRKSLGVYLAEAEASTKQLMDILGDDDIEHAELYSREASQVRLAVQGMDRVARLITRKSGLGEPDGEPFGDRPVSR